MAPLRMHRRAALLVLFAVALPDDVAATGVGNWSRFARTQGVHYHSVTHDAVHHRLIAFGGQRVGTNFRDVFILPLATGQRAWQQVIPAAGPLPELRHGSAILYDPLRDRLIVHGGNTTGGVVGDLWQLTLSGTPTWTPITVPGPGPGIRWGHSAIYDAPRDRLVIFGGNSGVARFNDVWALPLADMAAWQSIMPTGTPPPIRWGHVGVYDPNADRMVIQGGVNVLTYMNDAWAMSLSGTPAWTGLTPSGPPPSGRRSHAGAYDAAHNRLMLFGGYDGVTYLNDAWLLSLNGAGSWSSPSPAGTPPLGRYGTGGVYDQPRDQFVVFGGGTNEVGDVDDVWLFKFSPAPEWENVFTPSIQPLPRSQHALALDPTSQTVWMFGGSGATTQLYRFPLAERRRWEAVAATGGPPPARLGHTMTYDPLRQRLIVFGGSLNTFDTFHNDVWELALTDPPGWTQLSPTGTPPGARAGHTALYDPLRDRIVYFGGRPESLEPLDEVWSLSLAGGPAWELLTPTGTPPQARFEQAAAYDPVRDRMLVSGGTNITAQTLTDVWELSFVGGGLAWSPLPVSANLQRSGHTMLYDPDTDRMILHAGSFSGAKPELWELPLAGGTPTLALLSPGGTVPAARTQHAVVHDAARKRMILFGGSAASGQPADPEGYALDLLEIVLSTPRPRPSTSVQLASAYPDPAMGEVTLRFSLPNAAHARLRIYDVSGRLVETLADGDHAAGPHTLRWDRRAASGAVMQPGLYFYELSALGTRIAKRVVLIE